MLCSDGAPNPMKPMLPTPEFGGFARSEAEGRALTQLARVGSVLPATVPGRKLWKTQQRGL